MPLLRWFLAYAAGLLAGAPAGFEPFFPYGLAALALAHALVSTLRQPRHAGLQVLGLLVLFAGGGLLSHRGWADPPPDHLWRQVSPGTRLDLEGVVTDLPEGRPGRLRYRLTLTRINPGDGWRPVRGTVRLGFYGEAAPLAWRDRVRVRGIRLKRPRNFRNPGRFDYEEFMRLAGVDATGGTRRAEVFQVLGRQPLTWADWAPALRQQGRDLLEAAVPGPPGALLQALVFGQQAGLPESTREAFRATGLAHLLAVSGLHIGFVAAAVFALLYRPVFGLLIHFKPEWARFGWARKITALACVVPVLAYMALTGPRLSALRAGILVLVFLLALVLDREKHWLNTLVLAAWLVLLWQPRVLFQAGFQMSFLAVLAIVLLLEWVLPRAADPLERLAGVPWYRRWAVPGGPPATWRTRGVDLLMATFCLSAAAWVATFPVILYHFHRVSPGGLLMNLWAVPLASFLIPATLAVLALGLVFQGVAQVLLVPLGWLAGGMLTLTEAGATVPGMSLYLPQPPWPWLVFYAGLVLGWMAWRRRLNRAERFPLAPGQAWRVRAVLGICAAGVVWGLLFPRPGTADGDRLQVWMLDVGQGESLFIEFPNGKNLLLDGGGYFRDAFDVGTRVVGSFLWSRGIGKIDYLGATHSDQDHIDGVESILDRFEVGQLLDRPDALRDRRFSRLRLRALSRGVRPRLMEPGDTLRVGEVVLRWFHPSAAFRQTRGEPLPARLGNDYSWVIRLEYREVRVLLTGDITEEAERWLVTQGVPLKAQVLKAPHHGSRSSSSPAFLRAVEPRDALISSGPYSVFRHPHREVLARYQAEGIRPWRTDRQGALHLVTDGRRYRIETHEYLSHWD